MECHTQTIHAIASDITRLLLHSAVRVAPIRILPLPISVLLALFIEPYELVVLLGEFVVDLLRINFGTSEIFHRLGFGAGSCKAVTCLN